MSFGAGQSMVQSIKGNLSLKGKRKTFFDRKMLPNPSCSVAKEKQNITPQELKDFSAKFRKSHQKWIIKVWALSFFGLVIIMLIVYLLLK